MALSEYEVRKEKVGKLRDLGITPYAQKFDKKHTIADILSHEKDTFRDIEVIVAEPQMNYKTAGRLTLFRSHGKLSFAKVLDESGELQLMFHRDMCFTLCHTDGTSSFVAELGTGDNTISAYKLMEKLVDVGDFIGVEGELFVTHKGELTLFVKEFTFLAKAIQPLGDKFHGIGEDQERAYRQRYLDMIFNRESLDRMKLRSKFLQVIRQFYWAEGFMEVETPVLGNAASGAAARPFMSHHNDFDLDMCLRISPETNLKKATVGMVEKIFEIGKQFRNEGSDPSHHQEFTSIEHYAAYWNHQDNMVFTEKMFDYIFDNIPQLSRTLAVEDKNGVAKTVNFQTPWPRIDYVSQIKKDSDIDVSAYGEGDDDTLRTDIKAAGHTWEGIDKQGLTTMIDYLYKKVTRPQITGPAFIVNYPKLMQPLARASDTDKNIVEQWQLLINGWEVIKAYSELVDPQEQQANFDAQASALAAGDDEATAGDPDFVQAMEYGMPPQSGWGMGIDRIFALLTAQPNIRDVILFPMMKPEGGQEEQNKTERCHVIWQGYMKNFCNSEGKLHLFELKDGKFQYAGERNTDTVGYKKNIFNYFVEHYEKLGGQRIDDLEKKLGNQFENRYEKILSSILQSISLKSFTFTPENKSFLLEIMQFATWKTLFHKLWETKNKKNTKEELNHLTNITNKIIHDLSGFFTELLNEKWKWLIIYSEEDAFFSGDSIFHIRPNGERGEQYQNNLIKVLANPGSNIIFPLSKNIALIIEYLHPDAEATIHDEFLRQNIIKLEKGGILNNTHREQSKNGLYSESMEGMALHRIPQNCDWYLSGPSKEVIEKALQGYKNDPTIYCKDPLMYVIDTNIT